MSTYLTITLITFLLFTILFIYTSYQVFREDRIMMFGKRVSHRRFISYLYNIYAAFIFSFILFVSALVVT